MLQKDMQNIVSLFLIILLCATTWIRNVDYRDRVTLWRDIAAKSPNKSRAHNNFGQALQGSGNNDEAVRQYELALQLDPENFKALSNLAIIYDFAGRINDAIILYEKALSLNSSYIPARCNLALLYFRKGLLEDANREFSALIESSPGSKDAAFARNMIELIQRRKENR